jgi:WD40 repeat protein
VRNRLIVLYILISANCAAQKKELYIDKFTGINPVSYTDMIFTGCKDTVLVSTYSGRIARVIKGNRKERVVANIGDEIYALGYNPKRREIIASTLLNGIVIINELTGKIVRKLSVASSWCNSVVFSESYRYIAAFDQKGNRYLFDIDSNYKDIGKDTLLPSGRIISIDKNNVVTIVTSKKVFLWSLTDNKEVKVWNVELERFGDMDSSGNFLSINFNKCTNYDAVTQAALFTLQHPNWPYADPENPTRIYELPLQLQINAAKFAGNYIYTGSIDRSVRVWDKITGKLITTLRGHKGSISKLKVNKTQTQVVSVDLKGVINFWEVQ